MGSGRDDTAASDAIPDIRPWREIGWIFKDGVAVAIECRGGPPDEGDGPPS